MFTLRRKLLARKYLSSHFHLYWREKSSSLIPYHSNLFHTSFTKRNFLDPSSSQFPSLSVTLCTPGAWSCTQADNKLTVPGCTNLCLSLGWCQLRPCEHWSSCPTSILLPEVCLLEMEVLKDISFGRSFLCGANTDFCWWVWMSKDWASERQILSSANHHFPAKG